MEWTNDRMINTEWNGMEWNGGDPRPAPGPGRGPGCPYGWLSILLIRDVTSRCSVAKA